MIWDSEDWRKVRNRKLSGWFLGDENAVHCFIDISTVSETWDDLIDRDVPVADKEINAAFVSALVTLPTNPFYVRYRQLLEPLIIMSVNAWMDSELLIKRNDVKAKMLSFYIRNLSVEIAPMIAFCIGGYMHMRKVSPEIRDFFSHEAYEEWEHRHVA